MRIVIDGRLLEVRKTGGTQYSRRLISGLAALAPHHELLVLRRQASGEFAACPNVHELAFAEAALGDERWEQLQLPIILRQLQPEVFLSLTSVAPAIRCCPTATVVYDLGFWQHPEFYEPPLRRYLRRWLPSSALRAEAVVCLTAAVTRDVEMLYGVPANRLHVVPGAPDEVFSEAVSPAQISQLGQTWGLTRPFVLCVSSSERNKNLPRLVAAFEQARRQLAGDWQLVLVGPPGAAEAQLQAAIARLAQPASVVRLGFLPDPALPTLYQACTIFAFPSVFEGFGLPVLEAMAAGRPVLCSATGAVAEVTAGAALGVNVHSVEALAAALTQLLEEPQRREQLSAQARRRASEFSWHTSSALLLQALEGITIRPLPRRQNGDENRT